MRANSERLKADRHGTAPRASTHRDRSGQTAVGKQTRQDAGEARECRPALRPPSRCALRPPDPPSLHRLPPPLLTALSCSPSSQSINVGAHVHSKWQRQQSSQRLPSLYVCACGAATVARSLARPPPCRRAAAGRPLTCARACPWPLASPPPPPPPLRVAVGEMKRADRRAGTGGAGGGRQAEQQWAKQLAASSVGMHAAASPGRTLLAGLLLALLALCGRPAVCR